MSAAEWCVVMCPSLWPEGSCDPQMAHLPRAGDTQTCA
jgi:hypothetical protein